MRKKEKNKTVEKIKEKNIMIDSIDSFFYYIDNKMTEKEFHDHIEEYFNFLSEMFNIDIKQVRFNVYNKILEKKENIIYPKK